MVDVPSVDEYIAKVKRSGGEVAMPKTAIPGIGWLVYCRDTEGSLCGMKQSDPGAK